MKANDVPDLRDTNAVPRDVHLQKAIVHPHLASPLQGEGPGPIRQSGTHGLQEEAPGLDRHGEAFLLPPPAERGGGLGWGAQLALLVVTGALLAAAWGCGKGRENGAIHASGHIEATEVRLAAKVGGRLLELPFQEGSPVAAGAVVARFDTVDAAHELDRARAELDAADATLRLLLAGTRAEDVRQAEEELGRAQTELDAAARDLTRMEGLAERGTATGKARDDARTRRDAANRAVQATRALLDKLLAGPRAQEIEAARARKAAIAATVAGIDQRIADMTVLAPRGGVITERTAEPGEVLPAGAPLSVLTAIDEPWLTVYVDQPSLSRFALGDTVEVRVDGRSEGFAGTVSFVSPVAEFTPKNVQTPEERAKLVFKVKIALENRDGVFKPGMPADAYFKASSQSTVHSSQLRLEGRKGSGGTVNCQLSPADAHLKASSQSTVHSSQIRLEGRKNSGGTVNCQLSTVNLVLPT